MSAPSGWARGAWLALGLLIASAAPAAASYYVDMGSASCSNSGPGTEDQPYCTISAAVAAHNGPGVEIIVKPGIYRETVTIPNSGSAAGNFVIRASGPGVVVNGADDFSDPAKWTLSTSTVYLASTVTVSPFQVFVDGARLIPAAAGTTPSALAVNNFIFVSGQGLYVNLGGANPGTHVTEVGKRLYAFRLSAKSYVTIQGFHVTRTEDRAIYLSSNSNYCSVRGNMVDFAYRYGIAVSTGTGELIEQNVVGDNQDHGIAITSSSTGCTIQDNESYRNFYPTARASNGIYLNSSTSNLLQRNRLHNNQDTGLHLQTNSDNNISIQNVSYNNGDHGFDHLYAQNTIDIGNVAYGNYKDGFSIEGTSPGTHVYDCIAINNGLYVQPVDGVLEYDLWVDQVSSSGFVADYNIFWNNTSQYPVKFITTKYTTVAAYSAASGQDVHSLQLDPKFIDPANGNFHLQAGSPAIDSGISSVANWPATDADGLARVDDPATPNTGSGSPNFTDRGAFEFQASGSVPTAALTVMPSSGTAPLFVTADGSGSTDSDGTVASYRFDFGDGTVVGPRPGSSATHTYAVAGNYTVSLQVTDNLGYQNSTTRPVTAVPANQSPNGGIDTPASNVTIYAGQAVNFTGTGLDPDNNLPLTYVWNFGGGAANTTTEDPGPTIFNTPGTYNVSFTVTDGLGAPDPTPDTRVVTVSPPPTGTADDEIHWTFMGQTAVSFDWRGFDNTIRYGLTQAYGSTVTAFTPSPIPFSSPGPFWEARLTGLQENTVYHYSIGNGPDHTFHTPPPLGTSGFSVYAEGDIGDGSHYPNMLTLQNAIAADMPAFNLLVGDLTYGNTNGQAAVDTHFNNVMVWSQDAAYMPAWGNHEWESPTDDLRNYKGRFDLPNQHTSPNSPIPGGEDWYWFDYGNVRFIAYPEPWSGAWNDWATQAGTVMDAAQANPNIRYIVTIGHQPAYSSGYHAGEPTLKNAMDALGDTHSKYVLNINGHSHDYERSYPQHGVTHITTGTGGSELEGVAGSCVWNGGCPPPAWSAYRAMHHVRFHLTFTSTGIHGEALCGPTDPANDISCTPGTVIDSFDIDSPFHAPVVTAPPTASGSEGTALSIPVTAADADGDAISSLTATGLPTGATFTAGAGNTSGTLSWTPGYDQAGTYTVTFTASNALSGSASTTITVANVDRAPTVTVPASFSVNEGTLLTVNLSASDPDGGDTIASLNATGLPAGATFTAGGANTTGTLSWTPGYNQHGVYTVTFTASNALSGSSSTIITVNDVQVPPVVTAPPTASVAEGAPLTVNVTASDADGDAITTLVPTALPAGATFTAGAGNTSGTLSWMPGYDQAGSYTVTFTASNSLSGSASTTITVSNVDRPPVVTATATASVAENAPLTVDVTASDPDNDPISSLDVTGLPAGATFTAAADKKSGTLSWTPSYTQSGSYTVTFTASNALAGSATTAITVINVDEAPVVTAPATASGPEGALLTVQVTAADPNDDAISSLGATGLPVGATFTAAADRKSGTLSWTPSYTQAGTYTVTFTASNALSGSASTTITVSNVDGVPVVTVPATATVAENALLTVEVTAADPDSEAITSLAATGLPVGATFTAAADHRSGTLSWTPSFTQSGSYTVTFTASNALSGSSTTAITVTNVDRPPMVTVPSTVSGAEGTPLTIDVTASDPDGDAITSLTATGLPAGATFTAADDHLSGALHWTPTYHQSGSYNVTFTASNALTGSSSSFVTVIDVNGPPEVSVQSTATVAENALLTLNVSAADPDSDAITSLTATGLPAGATFTAAADNKSGTLSWTPDFQQSGTYSVTFTASNALSGSSTTTLTVTNVDRAPVVTATATASVAENSPLTVDVTALDPDNDPISSLDVTGLPAGATFTAAADHKSGTLSWTPSYTQSGSYTVTFTASNALSGSATTAITVINVDQAPVVTVPATASGAEGTLLTVQVTASDPNDDAISSLSATGLPAGATFTAAADKKSGTLSWTPSYAQAGTYTVTFTASNALSGSASTTITVSNVDGPPVVTAPATATVAENALLTVDVTAADPDSDAITSLTATGLPAGATFTAAADHRSGTLSWTPDFQQSGTYSVTFTASNALSGSSTTTLTVTNVDRAPVVTATATASGAENSPLTVDVTALDPDNDPIGSLDATGLPAGATFTAAADHKSGTLSWTPSFTQAGSYTVTFTASNALSGSSSTTITVANVDQAPVVTAPPTASVAENALLTVNVTAADPDNDAITSLTATGLPAGATFTAAVDNKSGTLSWTPGSTQSGTYSVTFTASNALSGSSTTTLTVTDVDRAPLVTATATASGPEGALLTVQVTAADPDSDAISSLSATGLPAGATFTAAADRKSGTLSWTPTFTQAGSYTVTFTASNALSGLATTTITVTNVDQAPVVTATATASGPEGASLTVQVTAADPDSDAISSLSATALPAGATFTAAADKRSGTLSWTPTFTQAGSYTVTFTASNALSGSATTAITVTNVDRAPVVTAPPTATASVGSPLVVNVSAADADGDAIGSLTATGLPVGATFTAGAGNTSGTLSWTPPNGSQGSYSVTFTASNALSGSATTVLTVASAQPPVAALTVTPVTGNEPLTVSADASASTDTDGSVVSYAFTFGDNGGTGSTPTSTASHTYLAGTYTLSVTVTDNTGLTSSKSVNIVVAQKLPGANLATNPSFEVDMTKWNAYGTATASRVSGGFDGAWSCAITSTAGNTSTFGLNDSPDIMHVTPAVGTQLRYRAWVRSSSSGGSAKLQVREYSGSTPLAAQVRSTGVTLGPSWQLLTLDYTCVGSGSTIDFQIIDTPLVAGETFQVDNVSVYSLSSTVGVGDVTAEMKPLQPLLAPSPMHATSSLTFLTSRPGRLRVGLYDVTGRRVLELADESMSYAGIHRFSIDGKGQAGETLSSGLYFYRIDAEEGVVSGRLIIAR
jgi:parallel beta-helix repeat protein